MKAIKTSKAGGIKIFSIKPFGGFVEIIFNVEPNYNNHSKLIPVSSDNIDKIKAMSAEEIGEKYIYNNSIRDCAA